MTDNNSNKVSPETPQEELSTIQLGKKKNVAGGWGAIFETFKHSYREMGLIRAVKLLLQLNQKQGFDCPGCAWPDPDDDRSTAEFCENGAKAVAEEATKYKIGGEFFKAHSVNWLSQQSDYWLGKQGRLTTPVYLPPGGSHYQEISWDEAFDKIANKLNSLSSPDEAAFYTSGRTSNEAAFLYQLFVRGYGTNNLPDCSNMCHESSGVGLSEVIGTGKGTVPLDHFYHAETIFIVGQNPGTNHPRMLTALQHAVRKGCKIVTINPIAEAGTISFKHPQSPSDVLGSATSLTHLYLPVKVNGDVALFKGIMKEMLAIDREKNGTVLDYDFIKQKTAGFDEFIEDLDQTSWEEILENSGVEREKIRHAAEIACESKATIACWAMGLTQHKNAVGNIQEIVNFLLMRGQMGIKGAGPCPVRGHSNVQGDRTMGIWEKPSEAFLDSLKKEFNFEPPREHGKDTVEAIKAMADGDIKVFFALGGNFLSATPDTEYTAKALQNCEMTVQVSTKLNRAHIITGQEALILPCLSRSEEDVQSDGAQFVTVENSASVVHTSQGTLTPSSPQLKSEVAIVSELAQKVLAEKDNAPQIDWSKVKGNYDHIRDHIEAVIPGFEKYNERVRKPAGFYLPNAVRDKQEFKTANGKANFTVHPIPKRELKKGQYTMMTVRSHDQYNTTIYGLNDRYRGVYHGRHVIFMNPEDMREENLTDGTAVNITSHFEGEKRTVEAFKVHSYDIPRQCVAAYFPEANPLVPVNYSADKSNTPVSKSITVSLSPT